MITFFRRIRQKLMTEHKFGKYLLYAIGEIFLVMIGILLALQVNTWKIEKENTVKEKTYLTGIKSDLIKDKGLILRLIPNNYESRVQFFQFTDSLVQNRSEEIRNIPFEDINHLYWPTRTFFPFVGTYSSLISDNSTLYITNTKLLHKIREIYDIDYQRLNYVGLILDDTAEKISWERRSDTRSKFANYTMNDYEQLYTDIDVMNGLVEYYLRKLNELVDKLDQCILAIEQELEKTKN
jgi:hypothetical protein